MPFFVRYMEHQIEHALGKVCPAFQNRRLRDDKLSAASSSDIDAAFAVVDADKDGFASRTEFVLASGTAFTRLDKDKVLLCFCSTQGNQQT
jgi:hypothetical protein